jgi:hypothetical protein
LAPDDDRATPIDALKRLLRLGGVLLVVMLAAMSCSSHGPSSRATSAPHGLRYEKGIPIPLPARAKSSKDVDPVRDQGEDIFITDDGFKPHDLTAKVEAQLWIHNDTDKAQVVRFENWPYTSPPIPPHGKVIYVPHEAVAVNYELESNTKVTGTVLFEPWHDPSFSTTSPAPS